MVYRIIGRVFEKSIIGIEHLTRKEKEEFPARAPIIEPLFSKLKLKKSVINWLFYIDNIFFNVLRS